MKIETDGNTTIISFPETKILDEQSFRLACAQLATEPGGKSVVFNCANLEGLSSAALAGLLILNSKILKARGTLTLSNVSDQVKRLLKSVAMDKLFGLEQKSRVPKQASGNSIALELGSLLYRADEKALASLESALTDWKAFYSRHGREIGVDLVRLKNIWQDEPNPWEVLIDVGILHHWVFEADHAEFFDEIVVGLKALGPASAVSMPWEELAKTEPDTDVQVFFAEVSAKLHPHHEALVILDKASDSYPLAILRLDALKEAKHLAECLEGAEVVVPGQAD